MLFKTQRIKLNIPKDMSTVLEIDCYLHEAEVLEEVHDIECEILSYGEVLEMDLDGEFNKMVDRYGAHPETGAVYAETVYGRRGRDLVNVKDKIRDENTEVTVIEEPVKIEKVPEDMSNKELKAALDDLGVDYAGNWSNTKLREHLISAQMEAAEDEAA